MTQQCLQEWERAPAYFRVVTTTLGTSKWKHNDHYHHWHLKALPSSFLRFNVAVSSQSRPALCVLFQPYCWSYLNWDIILAQTEHTKVRNIPWGRASVLCHILLVLSLSPDGQWHLWNYAGTCRKGSFCSFSLCTISSIPIFSRMLKYQSKCRSTALAKGCKGWVVFLAYGTANVREVT